MHVTCYTRYSKQESQLETTAERRRRRERFRALREEEEEELGLRGADTVS